VTVTRTEFWLATGVGGLLGVSWGLIWTSILW